MSNSIEDWRKQHTLPKQAPLPGLLSKLNILPQPERLPPPDDSALDTRSESSMEGSYTSPHHLSLSPMPPTSQPLTSPALAAQQRQVSGSAAPQSLTKANLRSPGRRASMVSHSPSMDKGASAPGQGVASLSIGGGGPGMSRLTIVRAPSISKERSGSSSHGSDYGGHHRRRSSSGSHHGSTLQPMTSSSPQVGSQRLSFAFTTFGGASNPSSAPGTPPGEGSDPIRPGHSHSYSSSSLNRRGSLSASGGHGGREESRDLTPREVVDLARETAQVNHQEDGASSVAGGGGGQEMEPVEFVPLTDEVLLPFDERPDEVQGLMDEDRNRSLFKLIEINFPNDGPSSSGADDWKAKDPSVWTYTDFAVVLGQVDRAELPDAQWARLIRKALKPRSEPLWEKLKGCLGIEEDEFEDGEVRFVGESAPGSPLIGLGEQEENRIFIEGLVEGEGVPMSDEKAFGGLGVDTGRRASSDDGGNSLIAGGGLFSPEPAGDGGLPSLNSLAGGSGMEAIGEEQEESPPPSRQATQMPSNAAFVVPPAIRTTLASPDADPTPRSSFSFYPTTDTPTPSSPSVAATDLKPLPVNQTYQPTSPLSRSGTDLPQSSSASTKSRTKSFVGISILSSSPALSHQAPPLSPSSPGASSYTPSLDDASYGGRHYEGSPAAYRGPGSPLFPSSFASLSLQSGGSASSFGGRRKLSTSGGH